MVQDGAGGRSRWVRVQRWRASWRRGSVGARLEARARVEWIRGFGMVVWRVGLMVVAWADSFLRRLSSFSVMRTTSSVPSADSGERIRASRAMEAWFGSWESRT